MRSEMLEENKEQPKKQNIWGLIMLIALLFAMLSIGIYIGTDSNDMLHSVVVHIGSLGWLKISVLLLVIFTIADKMFKKRDKSKYK